MDYVETWTPETYSIQVGLGGLRQSTHNPKTGAVMAGGYNCQHPPDRAPAPCPGSTSPASGWAVSMGMPYPRPSLASRTSTTPAWPTSVMRPCR